MTTTDTTTAVKPRIRTFVAAISKWQARELAGACDVASKDQARLTLTRVMLDLRTAERLTLIGTDSYVAVKRTIKPGTLVVDDHGWPNDREHACHVVEAKAFKEALNAAAKVKLPMPDSVILALDHTPGEREPYRLTVGVRTEEVSVSLPVYPEAKSYPQTERFVDPPYEYEYSNILWALDGGKLERLLKTRGSIASVRDAAHNANVRMTTLKGEAPMTNLKPVTFVTPFAGVGKGATIDDPSWVGTIMPVRV